MRREIKRKTIQENWYHQPEEDYRSGCLNGPTYRHAALSKSYMKKRREKKRNYIKEETFNVSTWVLNEFSRTKGTLHPYFQFKFWTKANTKQKQTVTSIGLYQKRKENYNLWGEGRGGKNMTSIWITTSSMKL